MGLLIDLSKPEHRRWCDALNAETATRTAACEQLWRYGPGEEFMRLVSEFKARSVELQRLPSPNER